LGLPFTVVASRVEELAADYLTAREMAMVNAHRKARAVAKRHPDALVLGADTVVALGDQVFGKPMDMAEARGMLRALSGRSHQVITGMALMHLRGYRERLVAEVTGVRFRALSDDEILAYLERIQPLDKAGAYAIQDHGELIVEEVKGSFTNVVGLPLELLREVLGEWGWGLGVGG
jgi:septum formation protein